MTKKPNNALTELPCRYNTSANFDTYKKDFITLYVTYLKSWVNIEHPSGIYITSSPTNGKESEKEGWVAVNPYDTHYGDGMYDNTLLKIVG